MKRRRFLAASALIGAAAMLPKAGLAQSRRPLRIPELIDARSRGQSIALEARAGTTEFYPGVASQTLGYNGAYLGPTLRLHAGDDVEVAVANRMTRATTVHWHGLLVPGELDGSQHQAIAPGATWRPVLPVRQPAATLFYHSHLHHETAAQVYFGLAGMLIVRDDTEAAFGLPSAYGVDDIPVIVQDRLFDRGRLVMPAGMRGMMEGARGDTILVNGTPDAYVRVPAGRVRLRLLNAANAREFILAFSDRRAFHWIASEGGLLAAPRERRSVVLYPGERAEILVDFSGGRGTTLVTAEGEPVLAFEVAASTGPVAPLPTRLETPVPWNAPVARVRRFTLDMGMMGMGMGMGMGRGGMMDAFGINGRSFDPARIDERVRLGATEIWEVSASMMPHPFHIHGVHFRVLTRGGRPAGPEDEGQRDTVVVDEPVRLLVRFDQPAVAAPFMYHCHILEHEDGGMMGQFTVT